MGTRKLTSRDRQAQETKNRIFTVASQLIIKKGYDNVTIDEIGRTAGIAKGLFYHYFKSKADIVVETYSIIDADFEKELLELDSDTSPVDKIFFTVNTMARYAKQRGLDFTKQIYKGQLDAAGGMLVRKKRPFFKTVYQSVIELQKQGLLCKEIKPDEHAHFIMAFARGILYDWCLHKGKYDVEVAMDECFRRMIFPKQKSERK